MDTGLRRYDKKNPLTYWHWGELSLGKVASLLEMDKAELRKELSQINVSVINEDTEEVIKEAEKLLEAFINVKI